MNPSVAQLREWSEVQGDNGEWIRVPSSAWLDVLWLLTILEDLEGNESVESAFADAAERRRSGNSHARPDA